MKSVLVLLLYRIEKKSDPIDLTYEKLDNQQLHNVPVVIEGTINAEIFEKNDESIIENYIQEIYPEKFENYENFLRNLDYERTGLKNILNVEEIESFTNDNPSWEFGCNFAIYRVI